MIYRWLWREKHGDPPPWRGHCYVPNALGFVFLPQAESVVYTADMRSCRMYLMIFSPWRGITWSQYQLVQRQFWICLLHGNSWRPKACLPWGGVVRNFLPFIMVIVGFLFPTPWNM